MLAAPYQSYVGPFGASVTRINYVIYLNGVLAINDYDKSPNLDTIQVTKRLFCI